MRRFRGLELETAKHGSVRIFIVLKLYFYSSKAKLLYCFVRVDTRDPEREGKLSELQIYEHFQWCANL